MTWPTYRDARKPRKTRKQTPPISDADVLALIAQYGPLTVSEMLTHVECSRDALYRRMPGLVRRGLITSQETVERTDATSQKRRVVRYAVTGEEWTERTDTMWEPWTQRPYVNPIRARLLGLPVAETERTRQVRAGGKAA